MVGDPRERRVAAILDAADHAAQLLEVLARLPAARPRELEGVRRFAQHRVEQFRRRQPIDPRQPRGTAARSRSRTRPIFVVEHARRRRRVGAEHAPRPSSGAEPGAVRRPTGARGANGGTPRRADPRADRPGIAAARRRPESRPRRKIPALCRRRWHAAPFERGLELAVAVARTEQDGDVRGAGFAADAGRPVPDRRARQQPDDLVGHALRRRLHRVADDEATARIGRLARRGVLQRCGPSQRRRPSRSPRIAGIDRKPIALAIPKRVAASGSRRALGRRRSPRTHRSRTPGSRAPTES